MKVRENLDAARKMSLHFKHSVVRGRELRLMDFKLGEKVVYPNHGVGLIEQISYGYVDGKSERFYMLRILSSGLKVMVPQANIESVGLRPVIRSTQAGAVLSYLEKGRSASHHDWKHRFKENSDRMRTGSLMEVAAVLKGLVALSRTKPLSFREKKMLERAKFLLVSELATVRNTSEQVVELNIVRALAKAKLQMPEAAVLPPD
ncbi:MAG: CarD family transcriptional regulator [Candidatus Acidiferrales bacterium]